MQKIDKDTEKKFLEAENYRLNKDFEKAIKIFEVILKQFPELPPALHNIAICYTELNRVDEAEKSYLKCLNIEPVSILSINNLAKLYYNNRQFNKAIPILQKSLLKKDDQQDIAEIVTQCLFALKHTNNLDAFCNQAIKKFPQRR